MVIGDVEVLACSRGVSVFHRTLRERQHQLETDEIAYGELHKGFGYIAVPDSTLVALAFIYGSLNVFGEGVLSALPDSLRKICKNIIFLIYENIWNNRQGMYFLSDQFSSFVFPRHRKIREQLPF